MTQDYNNEKHYIASEGKVFQRISNGFNKLAEPIVLGNELFLGNIILDAEGKMLEKPIEDKIEFYEEVEAPVNKDREHND